MYFGVQDHPAEEAARELLGYPHPRRVPRGVYAEQAIGISTDEFTRAKDSGLRFLRNVFPLIDLGFDRAQCMEFLTERGFGETVKSACVIFPISSSCYDSECCRVDLPVACALGAEERRRGSK